MTRVLALTKYDRAGPSSRVRTYQFLPGLAAAGLEVEVRPLFGDGYVERLYRDRERDRGAVARSCLARLATCLAPPRHDVVFLEKEALPWAPALVEALATARLGPIVVDYDDAIFHQYDLHGRAPVRALLGRKIDAVMRRAVIVTAGNGYLRERALAAGARRVEVLPSVVDCEEYRAAAHGPRERPVIGWIGSPSTARYVHLLQGPLERLRERRQVALRLIGSGPVALGEVRPEIVAWAEDRQADDLAALDIGVMPLADSPWERGKCGYKLIQYMAAGLPVVASAVGANLDIVEEGVTGFLVENEAGWLEALDRLAADPGLRARMGAAGRRAAEARFSTTAVGARLAQVLKKAAGR
jgi:glycosyltransferase involved in cell wall biosynthesis